MITNRVEMEANSDSDLKSNHLISDGTEDVVLLDSAATISADLTEATNEDQKIDLRHAKDSIVDNRDDKESSDSSDDSDDNDGKKDKSQKDKSQNDQDRKHEVSPVSNYGKKLTIDPKELEARVIDLLRNKLSMTTLKDTPQADISSKTNSPGQVSAKTDEVYVAAAWGQIQIDNSLGWGVLQKREEAIYRVASGALKKRP